MKRLVPLVIALPLFFTSCSNKCIEDAGVRAEREQTVKSFDGIEIAGPIKLILTQDSSYKVKVSADSNLVDHIKVDVSSSTLKLGLDTADYCGKDSIVVHAGIKDLKSLKAKSPSKVLGMGRLNLKDVNFNLNGSTVLDLDINAGKVVTDVDGTSKIHLTGQAGSHQFTSKGAIELDAYDFVVGNYTLDIKGVGKANINVLNDLNVKTSGATDVSYKGNPKNVNENKSGAGKLKKVN